MNNNISIVLHSKYIEEIITLLENIDSSESIKLVEILKNKADKATQKIVKKKKSKEDKIRKILEDKEIRKLRIEKIQKSTLDKSIEFREDLIKNQTEAEKVLKILLKQSKIKYEFQKVIYYKEKGLEKFYIADFYIPKSETVLEIDGGYHKIYMQRQKDKLRTNILVHIGVSKVIRFDNEEIIKVERRSRLIKTFEDLYKNENL